MICRACHFETPRLEVSEWHSAALPPGGGLAGVMAAMLTPAVTQSLPVAWRHDYSPDSARAWVRERDGESANLLAIDRDSGEPVGLMIVFEPETGERFDQVEIRLGYFLAESAWGRGLASELVEGFVSWCRSQPSIKSITGGVEADNIASAQVLTKNGFVLLDHPGGAEEIYELTLRDGDSAR